MPRTIIKEKPIGARITLEFNDTINAYLEGTDVSVGKLIRDAIQEYIWSHPVHPSKIVTATTNPHE